jgi:hypothetical protein
MSNLPYQTGLWHDHSLSGANSWTLTLTLQAGGYLTAALSTLVAWAGGSAVQICAHVLHHLISLKLQKDVLDVQLKVLLHDSIAALVTLLEISKLSNAWRKRQNNVAGRTLPILSLFALVWIAFTAAGILVGKVASKDYKDVFVLAKPVNCGYVDWISQDRDALVSRALRDVIQTNAARVYAKSFYSNTESHLAVRSKFPTVTLPYNISYTEPCPFSFDGESLCLGMNRSAGLAMSLDTGHIDSHTYFGINADPRDRVTYRSRLTCSPVLAYPFISGPSRDANSATWYYHVNLGPLGTDEEIITPFTFQWSNSTPSDLVGYQLKCVDAFSSNAFTDMDRTMQAMAKSENLWSPIPTFNKTNADVTVALLASNSVMYWNTTADPWFFTTDSGNLTASQTSLYRSHFTFTLMGCLQQSELCNPVTQQCTELSGASEVLTNSERMEFNSAQLSTAGRMIYSSSLIGIQADLGNVQSRECSLFLRCENAFSM